MPAEQPPRRIRIEGNGRHRDVAGKLGGHRPVGDVAESEEHAVDDRTAVDREGERQPHLRVVEGRASHVQHQTVRQDQRILEYLEPRVLPDEGHVDGGNPGEVQLTAHQGRELGGRLVHRDDDEPGEVRRPTQRSREVGIGFEDPPAIVLERHEAKGSVPDRVGVPGRDPHLRVGDGAQKMGGQDAQVRKHIWETFRGPRPADHDRRVVEGGDALDRREIRVPRIPGD